MKEKPKPMIVRFYKSHMRFIKEVSKRNKVSRAEVVRNAIELIRLNKEEERATIERELSQNAVKSH